MILNESAMFMSKGFETTSKADVGQRYDLVGKTSLFVWHHHIAQISNIHAIEKQISRDCH
jgi:hypothetical protein